VIFAAGLGLGYSLPFSNRDAPTDLARFASQAKAAHSLYVSEVLHPVEVAASEKDHLQTWLSNRLGAAIIAPQLGETGFPLIGGRLLPAGDQASALFMYENGNGDRLSLLATHGSTKQSQSFRFQEENGYLVVFWQDGPWQYSLVGDQKREPMGQIARLIHGQMI
jgi:anti-sigma factor RsiW